MSHENKNRLLELHYREGSPRRMKRTRRHLESCPNCREELEAMARMDERLTGWPDERSDPGTLERILAALPEPGPLPFAKPKAQPLVPLAGIAGGIAFVFLVLNIARSVLSRFSFWDKLQAGWLARTFGDFWLTLVLFLMVSGLAALSLTPFLLDYARRSESCHSR